MFTHDSPGSDEGGYQGGNEAAAHEAPVVAGVYHHGVSGRERQGAAQTERERHRLEEEHCAMT